MRTVLGTYLGEVSIGGRQTHKNLTLVPLLSAYTLDLEYLLLDEALSEGLIEIVEVSKEGAVPDLKVVNKSPRMVLILDGEELVGAKQNRIVNTTILIPGETVVIIPVSCVEAGRWNYESAQFYSEKRIMSAELRAKKADQVNFSLRTSGRHRSDQGAIWDGIAEKAARRGARSPSMAMSEIYKKDRPSLEEYTKHFHLIGSQVGAVFMIGGKVAGMDAFGKPETFSSVFRKLVESYALDAIDWFDPQNEGKSHKSDVMAFLKDSLTAVPETRPAVGKGTDYRFSSEKVTGFALCLDDRILHLSIFAKTNGMENAAQRSRISRFSRRSRARY
jgi:hypothetical protein